MEPRKIDVAITYDTTDISEYISPYLKSFSYQDHLSGQADDLQLTLMDIDGLWQSVWMPDKGATLDVSLSSADWRMAGEIDNAARTAGRLETSQRNAGELIADCQQILRNIRKRGTQNAEQT